MELKMQLTATGIDHINIEVSHLAETINQKNSLKTSFAFLFKDTNSTTLRVEAKPLSIIGGNFQIDSKINHSITVSLSIPLTKNGYAMCKSTTFQNK
jgi:hypothetical protein